VSELPPGWARTSLGEMVRWGSGGTPRRTIARYYGGSIPWAVIGDLNDGIVATTAQTITSEGLAESSAKLVEPGTVLVAMYGSIGKLGIAGVRLATNQAIAFAQPRAGLDARYLYWFLRAERRNLRRAGKGATQKNISQTVLRGWVMPLPPLNEQGRIVAAIEEHLSRLAAADASLAAAMGRLSALFRSAVVAAVDASWPVRRFGDLGNANRNALAIGPFGSSLKVSDYTDSGVPLIFVRDIRRGRFGDPGTRFISEQKAKELAAHTVRPGDLLVTKMGDPPGDAAVYPPGRPHAVLTADCIKVTPGGEAKAEYLALMFQLPAVRTQIAAITSGVAQKKVSLARFRSVEVPVPLLEDQRRIVAEVEQRLSAIAAMRASLERAQRRSKALRAAILERAFRGELVPQDPADEPAENLLTRIRES